MTTRKKISKGTSSRIVQSSHSRSVAKRKNETCFIIMPFGSWFDQYYQNIYIPAIESVGLRPRRADDLYRPSAIVNDIWTLTRQAKLILADLSGKNPNVFYELGLAHAIAKPAVLVAEDIDDIPFDLRALRVIIYNKNEPYWGDTLRQKIETAITEVINAPLDSVLPTFLTVQESSEQKTVTQAEKDLISLRQDLELVKRELQLRESARPKASTLFTRSEGMRLARLNRERGTNDEVTITQLCGSGWTAGDAIKLIRQLDQEYEKQFVALSTVSNKHSSKKS